MRWTELFRYVCQILFYAPISRALNPVALSLERQIYTRTCPAADLPMDSKQLTYIFSQAFFKAAPKYPRRAAQAAGGSLSELPPRRCARYLKKLSAGRGSKL